MPVKRREPLSRERVLRAAIELADEEGLEALTMRRLAKALGVEAMSLYNHVRNKEELLAGILDVVADEVEPAEGTDWRTALRRAAISEREVLLRHPWASPLRSSSRSGGHPQFEHADRTLRTLREAGFPPELVYHAFHVLDAYVLGYASLQLSFPKRGEELPELAAAFLERFPVADYPDLAEHIRGHLEPPEGGGFELGLDLLLDGLARTAGVA
jgi:AcrR family transcriptional regulator